MMQIRLKLPQFSLLEVLSHEDLVRNKPRLVLASDVSMSKTLLLLNLLLRTEAETRLK